MGTSRLDSYEPILLYLTISNDMFLILRPILAVENLIHKSINLMYNQN